MSLPASERLIIVGLSLFVFLIFSQLFSLNLIAICPVDRIEAPESILAPEPLFTSNATLSLEINFELDLIWMCELSVRYTVLSFVFIEVENNCRLEWLDIFMPSLQPVDSKLEF